MQQRALAVRREAAAYASAVGERAALAHAAVTRQAVLDLVLNDSDIVSKIVKHTMASEKRDFVRQARISHAFSTAVDRILSPFGLTRCTRRTRRTRRNPIPEQWEVEAAKHKTRAGLQASEDTSSGELKRSVIPNVGDVVRIHKPRIGWRTAIVTEKDHQLAQRRGASMIAVCFDDHGGIAGDKREQLTFDIEVPGSNRVEIVRSCAIDMAATVATAPGEGAARVSDEGAASAIVSTSPLDSAAPFSTWLCTGFDCGCENAPGDLVCSNPRCQLPFESSGLHVGLPRRRRPTGPTGKRCQSPERHALTAPCNKHAKRSCRAPPVASSAHRTQTASPVPVSSAPPGSAPLSAPPSALPPSAPLSPRPTPPGPAQPRAAPRARSPATRPTARSRASSDPSPFVRRASGATHRGAQWEALQGEARRGEFQRLRDLAASTDCRHAARGCCDPTGSSCLICSQSMQELHADGHALMACRGGNGTAEEAHHVCWQCLSKSQAQRVGSGKRWQCPVCTCTLRGRRGHKFEGSFGSLEEVHV